MTQTASAAPGSALASGAVGRLDGWTDLDDRAVAMIRGLAMDAVQKAGNGHPGTAMSLAPAAYLLFQRFLRQDPADPHWLGRDRFVLSCGHSSLTLYIQLFLSGYGLELDDLRAFRTWGSRTPGHPEFGHTSGVETTTGPLGQGLATAVGMAMAARYERGLLDPDAPAGTSPFDHHVWVLASDGDLEEGVTSEASSLAGVQRLSNLTVIWDDNRISIEGDTSVAFTEDVSARYAAYGWAVHEVDMLDDGNVDVVALSSALESARDSDRPTFIRMRSIIAWPAPNARNTGKSHGAALGDGEVAATKVLLGLDPAQSFEVDDTVLAHARAVADRAREARAAWEKSLETWRAGNPDAATLLERLRTRGLPADLDETLPTYDVDASVATRVASGDTINALATRMPELWGGSADLAGSNNTSISKGKSFLPFDGPDASPYGRIVHFGIREHAMGAILNGIALSGLTRPFGGTFLVFSDYMRGAVRLSALMQLPVVFVWTHDSIGLGEDGPTHQPVETLWALRAIPGLAVVRPADANETAHAWLSTLRREHPVGLALSRQNLPVLPGTSAAGVDRGGYVIAGDSAAADVLLMATGSEVSIALQARDLLANDGVTAAVISMPCLEWFDEQDAVYRESVLPSSVRARVSVEAGIAQGWWKYVGQWGRCVSLEHFGASASAEVLYEKFGITAQAVVDAARESIASSTT